METGGVRTGEQEQGGNEGDGWQQRFWPVCREHFRKSCTFGRFLSCTFSQMVTLFLTEVLPNSAWNFIFYPKNPQSQDFHQFADARSLFLGIPNTLNVISNVPFLVVGAVGLVLCYRANYFQFRLRGELYAWPIFFISVAAIGIGSSYYHLQPNDADLLWDHLPMTVAFTSIVAIFIIERINENTGTQFIIPLILAGIIGILLWRFFDGLCVYGLVLVVSWISILIMAIRRPMYTHSTYWVWAAVFYLLAKVEEAEDKPIYRWTHCIISGHTLKHLFAVMVPVFLTLMLAKRSVQPERESLPVVCPVSWVKVTGSGGKMETTIVCPCTTTKALWTKAEGNNDRLLNPSYQEDKRRM